MKRLNLLMIGVALALPTLSQAATGGIEGSPHDLSGKSWNTRYGVCSPCHAAHGTDANQLVPLWSHATSAVTDWTMYTSPSMNAAKPAGPTGTSLACLSCHDGVTALNATISGTITGGTPEYIDDAAVIGTDLHTTHPISFTYDAALATADGGLENPDTYKIGDPKPNLTVQTPPVPATWSGTSLTGKSITAALLSNGKMQCSSCHDVHKTVGSSPTSGIMAKISGADSAGRGSTLCRTCHIK